MKNIAIFASGTGTNAERIIGHFKGNATARVALIVSSKPDAGVVNISRENNIPCLVLDKMKFRETEELLAELEAMSINFIVLAGFLWLVPEYLVRAYNNKMVNIHPALLPKYGGKGMYGMRVHEAVINAGEKESGISIHFVNERYDEGGIVFQGKCPVKEGDTPGLLAGRIHRLEHEHYPAVIEKLVNELE